MIAEAEPREGTCTWASVFLLTGYEHIWVNVKIIRSEEWFQDAFFQTLIKTQRKFRKLSGNIASKRDALFGIAWHDRSSNLHVVAWSCQPVQG